MRSMSRVERFFERLVERPSARLFRTRLQPIQVLRRVERAMEAGRRSEAGRDVAPDRFTVRLHPADLAELGDPAIVAGDVASGALAFARSHGLALADRPRVAMRSDPAVVRGDVEVEASVRHPRTPASWPRNRTPASSRSPCPGRRRRRSRSGSRAGSRATST